MSNRRGRLVSLRIGDIEVRSASISVEIASSILVAVTRMEKCLQKEIGTLCQAPLGSSIPRMRAVWLLEVLSHVQ